jgi:hypothetical protein
MNFGGPDSIDAFAKRIIQLPCSMHIVSVEEDRDGVPGLRKSWG